MTATTSPELSARVHIQGAYQTKESGVQNMHGYSWQVVKTTLPLLVSDVVSWLTALCLGSFCAATIYRQPTVLTPELVAIVVGSLIVMFVSMGLYSSLGMNPIYEFRQCMVSVTVGFLLVAGANFNASNGLGLLLAFPITLVMVSVMRSTVRQFLASSSWWGVNSLVYNCDRRVNRLYPLHQKRSQNGFRPIGFVQEELPDGVDKKIAARWLGNPADTAKLMEAHDVHVAIVHRRGRSDNDIAKFVEQYLSDFAQVVIVPDDDRIPSLWSMGTHGGILIKDRLLQPSSQLIKRTMDVLFAGTGLLLGFPVFLGLAIWMKITSPGPLFFGHERIGRNGRRFKAWKFRSMCVNADEVLKKTLEENPEMRSEWEATQKLKDDPRVSSSGRFLRKTSLDEIPQLWNVLKGEMSLVGPRPIVANEIEKYDEKFKSYTRVIPGVTGFWQISGRNLTTYERRVELDDYYVRNWSVWFDLYILARTVKTVILREGAF